MLPYRLEQAGREPLDWIKVDAWRAANEVRRMHRRGFYVDAGEYRAERAAVAAADAEDAADEAAMADLATVEGRG